MAGERVPSLLLEAGDVIHVCHHHDSEGGDCLSHWEIDAVVIEKPAPMGDRVAVRWANKGRLLGTRHAITGINLFRSHEQVLRIGRLPVTHPA
jgi:hypothetical protein